MLAAVAALVAWGAQAQPSVTGVFTYPVGNAPTKGGLPSGVDCSPPYPAAAQDAHAEGVTRLKLAIGARRPPCVPGRTATRCCA